MPLPKLSEEDVQFKLQENQEVELICLQRQYNLLEKNRELYNAGASLNRMNKLLHVYRREHQNITIDLTVASGFAKTQEDNKVSNNLQHILVDHESYNKEVKKQRQYLQEIDGQIKKLEKEVVKLRTTQITDRQYEERVRAAFKTRETLMNKLDVQNKMFGTFCTKNADLKAEIQTQLRERNVFIKIWKKLIDKLTLGKRFMMDLIEQATIAYDQREEWCSKLQALRIKAQADLVIHTEKMRHLKGNQDKNAKLEEFFYIKGQKRILTDLEMKKRKAREAHHEKLKQRFATYQQFMAEIFEFTKEKKVETIAKKFHIREYDNFSIFQYINDMCLDTESLNDQLDDLSNQIVQKDELAAAKAQQRQNELTYLTTQREVLTQELETSKKELTSLQANIKAMLAGINTLFVICKCHKDPILQLLDKNKEINLYNAFFYLEMIEQAIHIALVEVYCLEKSEFDKKKIAYSHRIVCDDHRKRAIRSLEEVVTSNACPLCAQREVVTDIVDNLQIPNSRQMTQRLLAKRGDVTELIHNVSKCFLPESRDIVQKRYQ